MPSVFRRLLRTPIRLWRVVKLTSLYDVFFVVVNTVAIYIDADLELVLLAVVDIAGVKRKAVLAAQERIDRTKDLREFAWEGNRVIDATAFTGKCFSFVLCLKKGHASRHSCQSVRSWKVGLILFIEQFTGADYVDGNTSILRNLASVSVINLAKGVDAGRYQYDGAAPALHGYQTRVVRFLLLGILEHDRVATPAYQREFKRIEKVGLAKCR